MTQQAKCELCGEPMPDGETMFRFHGYSGPCPKPPLPPVAKQDEVVTLQQLRIGGPDLESDLKHIEKLAQHILKTVDSLRRFTLPMIPVGNV